jgi:hypothetical protein
VQPNPKSQPLTKQRRPDGRIVYVVGFTGSGKTTWVRQQVRHAPRLLVWDGKGEWGEAWGCRVVTHPHALLPHVLSYAPPARISYRVPVSREAFAVFCKLAWVYCRSHGGVLVVEELADVTTSSKAPIEWGEIVRKSRGAGSMVYALTQRPQEVDKTVQGNASVFHVGMMADAIDGNYVARRLLACDPADVAALRPLEFIERDVRSRLTTRGKVSLRQRK